MADNLIFKAIEPADILAYLNDMSDETIEQANAVFPGVDMATVIDTTLLSSDATLSGAVYIGDVVQCLYGITLAGGPWFFITKTVHNYPKKFINYFNQKNIVFDWVDKYDYISNVIVASHLKRKQWLISMGFTIVEPSFELNDVQVNQFYLGDRRWLTTPV